MKRNDPKELYQQLRKLSCEELWNVEVAQFNNASPQERLERVAVVRAVGVVFSESGTGEQKKQVRDWLLGLLQDPNEKIRRYAMSAMPKVGGGAGEEAGLLSLMQTTNVDREKKYLGRTLEKIGGAATLEHLKQGVGGLSRETEQKVKASLARVESPSVVNTDRVLTDFSGVEIHLRGRRGLERFVRDEVEDYIKVHGKFRVKEVRAGLVSIVPTAPFSLADIYSLRCFGSVGFVLGTVRGTGQRMVDGLAGLIVSRLSRRVLETFTEGSLRYRLDFVTSGHQRGLVRLVTDRAYALCSDILNDARHARWTVSVYSSELGSLVELVPKLAPDPRFAYRQQDVPAASHPPLAAAMARESGVGGNDIVWDPFCGSGLELIERAMLGGVQRLYGTDLSAEAVEITRKNLASAKVDSVPTVLTCCDFRDFAAIEGLGPNSVTLVITNPPLGKRVPIPNLNGLIRDLFRAAATVLKPGGRLVFANPFRMQCPEPSLQLQTRQKVDFVGFDCYLEKYVKR